MTTRPTAHSRARIVATIVAAWVASMAVAPATAITPPPETHRQAQLSLGGAAVLTLDGEERRVRDFAGRRGLVVVFWASWSERSLEQLARLGELYPRLAAKGLGCIAVSVEQHAVGTGELASITAHVQRLDVRLPVVADAGLRLFSAAGVIAVPTTIVLDANERVVFAQSGYALEHREAIVDAIERQAGLERPAPTASTPPAAPKALRYLQLGRTQLGDSHDSAARASFEASAAADPSFPAPLVELAALALDGGAHDLARELLERARALDVGYEPALIEQGRLSYVSRRVDEACAAWRHLGEHSSDPLVHAYLAFGCPEERANGQAGGASRAAELGGPDIAGLSGAGRDALSSMRAYRRALTAKRRWGRQP